MAVFQRKLATLPLATYQAGENVLSAASTTGRLLILKEGAVAVVKEGVEIAKVTEPGAVFGELSVLLDQPHTADVRALEASQFHVADAATILRIDPIRRNRASPMRLGEKAKHHRSAARGGKQESRRA
jgi:CRP/FNR family transcriptional regulator, cyclic AMP receptor protein